jgi:hypothetical protein
MQIQVDIGFDQLLKIVKTLPVGQLQQLKAEIEKEVKEEKSTTDLETILLNGPVATPEQLAVIEENRKTINQWRTN